MTAVIGIQRNPGAMETTQGTLYVVSTPIGNADDISLRAVKILKTVDVVVCEEGKVGARLLHQLRLSKTIEELHEHNEQEQSPLLLAMLKSGKSLALVSDAGTPLLADPGLELVQQAVQSAVPVVAVPGASSIMTALVASGLPVHQFVFAGFLSRDSDTRLLQFRELAAEKRTVVLLETPYRLLPLLEAAAKVMPERRAFLGCNLTMPSETRHYGTVAELLEKFTAERFKGEFVFVFAGAVSSTEYAVDEGGMAAPRRRESSYGKDAAGKRSPERGGFGKKNFEKSGFGKKSFGKRDSERGGFGKRDSERGGFGKRDSERGGFGKRDSERGGFGKRDSERGGFGKRDSERGGFGKRDSERGGFGKRDSERGGFSKKGFDKGGFGKKRSFKDSGQKREWANKGDNEQRRAFSKPGEAGEQSSTERRPRSPFGKPGTRGRKNAPNTFPRRDRDKS